MHLLGGGSNNLLTGDVPGLLIKNEIGGMEVVEDGDDYAIVAAGGGVVWHELVLWCIEKTSAASKTFRSFPAPLAQRRSRTSGRTGLS